MSKDNRDFFKEKKDWSEIKDTLLGAYLKPYFQKVLMTKRPIFYVDCFSGKGRFDDGKPGSPIIALDIRKDCIAQTRSENAQIDMCFIDLNYASDLELNLSSYNLNYGSSYAAQANENVIENVIEISEEKIKKLMPEYSKKKLAKAYEILKMISENPNISIDELRIALDVTDRTIARYISELKDKGIIERKGPDNGGEWKIR